MCAVSPALLTNPVTGPSVAAAAKSLLTSSSLAMSPGTATARAPAACAAAATLPALAWSLR